MAFVMESFHAIFPGNESNRSPIPETNFIWNFFWVHLLPPGNKFFTILRFLLKAMATNPLPWLQGSWKQWQQILCQSFKVSWKQWLQIFCHSFKVSWKQWPASGTFWKVLESNFLWNHGAVAGNKSFNMPSTFLEANSCEIAVLFLATNPSPCLQVPQRISYQILVPFLATSSFTTPSRFLTTISYEIDLAAIPSNKYFPISSRVPESNFLWNPSWCQFLMKSWWHFQQIAFTIPSRFLKIIC